MGFFATFIGNSNAGYYFKYEGMNEMYVDYKEQNVSINAFSTDNLSSLF